MIQNTEQSKNGYSYEDEVDLLKIIRVIFNSWKIIFSTVIFCSFIAIAYSLSMPNIYQSQSTLVTHQSASNTSNTLQGYSGIASLAGISVPSQGLENNSAKAKAKLVSFSFFKDNILPNIFLPSLMALEYWDSSTNTLLYDLDIYDASIGSWANSIPSAQDSYKAFIGHMSLSENNENGFITLRVKHQSPFVAKEWSELLISEINTFYRNKDKIEAEKAVDYINNQLIKTNLAEIKQVLATLLQQEIQKLMLIEVNESYVYEFLDPPIVMEKKSEPNRTLIFVLGIFMGAFFGSLYALVRHYYLTNISEA
jgi:capsular polysaccharide biosynthesis protein